MGSATYAADFLENEALSEAFIDFWLDGGGELGSGSTRCDFLLIIYYCLMLIGFADRWLATSSLAIDADFLLITSYLILDCLDFLLAISSISSLLTFYDFLLSISAS